MELLQQATRTDLWIQLVQISKLYPSAFVESNIGIATALISSSQFDLRNGNPIWQLNVRSSKLWNEARYSESRWNELANGRLRIVRHMYQNPHRNLPRNQIPLSLPGSQLRLPALESTRSETALSSTLAQARMFATTRNGSTTCNPARATISAFLLDLIRKSSKDLDQWTSAYRPRMDRNGLLPSIMWLWYRPFTPIWSRSSAFRQSADIGILVRGVSPTTDNRSAKSSASTTNLSWNTSRLRNAAFWKPRWISLTPSRCRQLPLR